MLPAGPLMAEHRLIERMVRLMKAEASRERRIDLPFIDAVVDFLRTYADKTHHGKEEDILFRELGRKPLSSEHRRIMDELVNEHAIARKSVSELKACRERYAKGDPGALEGIISALHALAELYPKHIETEDKRFFLPVMAYFSEEEQQAMLERFWEFDRRMIHSKYKDIVGKLF